MSFLPNVDPGDTASQSAILRVLLIEDSEIDAELLILELDRGGYQVIHRRVETAQKMKTALRASPWDVIISDYSLPTFDASAALNLLQESGLDIPFIVVSGKIGEETAVSLMKAGAHDYLKKDNLTRLEQIVRRELAEARVRRDKIEAREALRASEERFRTLTELLPVGVYLADTNGKYLYTNQKWLEMTGLTIEEALGDGWSKALHPGDRDAVLQDWSRVVDSGGKTGAEFRFCHPQGVITEVIGISNVLNDEHGNQIGYIGAAIDITERKKADEELRKSQARLLESQQSAHIGNWEFNPRTREFHNSDEVLRILGLDPLVDQLSLENIIPLIGPENKDRIKVILQEVFEKSIPFDVDIDIRRKDGVKRYVNANASVRKDEHGGDLKIIGTVQDITPRKIAEIENEKLMVEFRRQTQEREAVIDISSHMRKAQTHKEMLPILANESMEIADADAGAVLLLDENRLDIAATSGVWQDYRGEGFSISNDLLWEIVHANEAVFFMREEVVRIAGQMEANKAQMLNQIAACSLMPIKAGESGIGLLVTGYCKPQEFTNERIDLLMTIAEIAGNTMQRMRTMEILEQLVTNRTRELSTIYNVVSAVSESVEIDKSLDRVLDQVLTAMEAKYALFFQMNEEGDRLRLTAEKGLSPGHKESMKSISLDRTWEGWIVRQGEPLVIPNIRLDNRMVAPGDFSDGIYSYLGAPMHSHGKVTGVLGVIRKGKPFNVDDILLISAIVDHIGLILENAKLHKRAGQLAIVEERSRLARDLHDSATQTMYSAMLFAETSLNLAERGETGALISNLKRLSQLSQQALREMRLLVYELRPSVLEQDGLIAAIRQRLEMVEKRVGIRDKFIVHAMPPLHPGVEMALYRITLEALNNVLKHAEATEVEVEISSEDGKVFLTVSDNGVGFDETTPKDRGGIGLSSMRERTVMLGGEFEISSTKNQGTQIRVKLPVVGDTEKSNSALEDDLEISSPGKRSNSLEEENPPVNS
ncbi:MAG: PAS domain S-box protein [Anaerolineaceae bacterium]